MSFAFVPLTRVAKALSRTGESSVAMSQPIEHCTFIGTKMKQ